MLARQEWIDRQPTASGAAYFSDSNSVWDVGTEIVLLCLAVLPLIAAILGTCC